MNGNEIHNNPEEVGPAVGRGDDVVFALDIGTRSVIGIVGRAEGEMFRAEAVEVMEHTERAVIDGQIEDIEKTAFVAGMVRQKLEKRLGYPLREVCVAAAGRTLKTVQTQCTLELGEQMSIEEEKIAELESKAIQAAFDKMTQENPEENRNLLCVGHSVIRYWLDGYEISNLLHHKGREIRADIIATFLPGEVVESLYAVMERVGLTVASITLEPIAAMNAVIPRELRMLNLALVDIGGGTSDIAISSGGSVAAYTMATVAGDEITEAIMQECLADFATAEQIKLALSDTSRPVSYTDILGLPHETETAELLEKLHDTADVLAEEISRRILESNGKAPAAVFLVGGGSQLPPLRELVAEHLGIGKEKVAVGGGNYMKRTVLSEEINGPEFATPLGIALTALANLGGKGLSVRLNGKKISLLKNGSATVLEVLMLGGYQYGQIMGRSGVSVVYERDGEKVIVRGKAPFPAEIMVNGAPAAVSSMVGLGDEISFIPAQSGENAAPTVESEARGYRSVPVTLNGFTYRAGTQVRVNGAEAEPARRIENGDKVEISEVNTLNEFCRWLGMPPEKYSFVVGGEPRGGDYRLQPGDQIRAVSGAVGLAPETAGNSPAPEKAQTPPAVMAQVYPGNETRPTEVSGPRLHVRINGSPVELVPKEDGLPYQFVDMLNYVDIDPTKPRGNIILRLNGQNASYLEPVREGDRVEILWDSAVVPV